MAIGRLKGVGTVSGGRRAAPAGDASRFTRLAGAAQSFLSPSLSTLQSGTLKGVGDTASLQGLFGGAVRSAVDRTQTQFLAGNRAAGLQGLVDQLFAKDARGATQFQRLVNKRGGGEDIPAVLSQILGIQNQFRFGGQAGRENVLGVDSGQVGGFARVSPSQRASNLTVDELGRRLAEQQGITDTAGFVRDNNAALQRVTRRAQLLGLNSTASQFQRDFFGAPIADGDMAPDIQGVVQRFIGEQTAQPKFGIRAGLFPAGLQGLAATGLLPFGAAGGQTLPGLFAQNRDEIVNASQDFFSPLLFR